MAAWRKSGILLPSGLENTLCRWEIYVPLVTKGLKKESTVIPLLTICVSMACSG
jgi:hypothetical protein